MNSALILKISADASALRTGLERASSSMQSFTNKISQIGGLIQGAFAAQAVSAIGKMAMEFSTLAAKADGVRAAFDKIPNSAKLMRDLKEATASTVSELELMQNAVKFKNFNLDLEQMPKLLRFATLRAQETGESVDYLVNSIVTGLGRKSVMILDNLGLSSAAINEEIAKTGDFFKGVGNIVDREIGKMTPLLESTITQTARLSANFEELKIKTGNLINESGVLVGSLREINGVLTDLAAIKIGGNFGKFLNAIIQSNPIVALSKASWMLFRKTLDAMGTTEEERIEGIKKQIAALEQLHKTTGLTADQQKEYLRLQMELGNFGKVDPVEKITRKNITTLEDLQEQLKALEETKKGLDITNKSEIATTNIQIKQLKERIELLNKLGLEEGKTARKKVSVNLDVDIGDKKLTDGILGGLDKLVKEVPIKALPIQNSFIDLSETVRRSMESMAFGIGDSIGNMLSGIGGLEQIAGGIVGVLGQMAQQIGALMIQFGFSGIALKKFALKPGAAIAAGVALVALGKILSNKAQAIASGGGGGRAASGSESFSRSRQGESQDIRLTFEPMRLEGNTLIAAINQTNDRNRYTRG